MCIRDSGADYQYLFTYISTNKERLGKKLGDYFNQKMQPQILREIEKKGILSVSYTHLDVYKRQQLTDLRK